MLAEADTITIEENNENYENILNDGDQTCTDPTKAKELLWIPPEVRFQDIHNRVITHSTFNEGYCGKLCYRNEPIEDGELFVNNILSFIHVFHIYTGIAFKLSKYGRNGNITKSRQQRIENILGSVTEIAHREINADIKQHDEQVQIVEYPDPLEMYVVTDVTNLLIFEQEINMYNERNGYAGDPPPIMYEQMSPNDKQSFYFHIVVSDDSSNIFQQVIFEDPVYEEKEVCFIHV